MKPESVDVDVIAQLASPLLHQHAHEIQPFSQLMRLPNVLSEVARDKHYEEQNVVVDAIAERIQALVE